MVLEITQCFDAWRFRKDRHTINQLFCWILGAQDAQGTCQKRPCCKKATKESVNCGGTRRYLLSFRSERPLQPYPSGVARQLALSGKSCS
jgi:hypothetical protein